jgi:mRNA-degrading endonuclease RelE of RelBE toxin-antitoxin system
MVKIAKLLKKLSEKEREHVSSILSALLSGKTSDLDVKKLQGVEDIYRVRVGSLRIIFRKSKGDIRVLEISCRDSNTYNNY